MWFPAEEGNLRQTVSEYINGAEKTPVGQTIVAAIAPHAGYMYSGRVAGHVYRASRDAGAGRLPETVVVIGFRHRGGGSGVSVMDGEQFETPLGRTPMDREGAEILTKGAVGIRTDYSAHVGEHSVENQVPFIQVALPQAKLLLLAMNDHDSRTLDELVQRLNGLASRKRILVVASSDMLHDPSYERVKRTDKESLQKAVAMDDEVLLRDWTYAKQTFCGIGAVSTVIRYAREQGCREGLLLHYRNSGDDFPESRGQWVVGYGAVVFPAATAGAPRSS